MQRDIIAKLNAWKASEYRKPLILKGARQVGKTWALKEFGRTSYRNFVYLTLEEPSPGVQSEYAQFSKVRAILDGSSQIFPWHLDSLSSPAKRCLLLMRSRIVLLQSAPLNTSVTRPPSITSHAQGLCWAFACPVRPALFRWERSSSWRCAP